MRAQVKNGENIMSINNFIAKSHRVNAAEGLNQTLLTSGITFRKIQQRPLPAQ